MKRLMLLLLLCALTLSACTAPATTQTVAVTLPPASNPYAAPTDDSGLGYAASTALYLPSRDGQRLIAQYTPLWLRHDVHPARAILEALLSFPANDDVHALGSGALSLHSQSAVEVSSGVCTVNLASSARQLTHQQLYTVCLAIASTLCELPDIDTVNVLIAGQAIAMDITDSLPLGAISPRPGEELPVLWEQMEARRAPLGEDPASTPVSATATLYFPLADGSGFLPETRSLSFSGQRPQQLALELVNALSTGAQYVTGTAEMPNVNSLLNVDPIITDLEDGGRLLTLRFNTNLEERLRQAGLDMPCFLGALHRTLTTFIPSISMVRMYVGDVLLTSLYSRTQGSQLFADGVMLRQHFDQYLMEQVTLYFARDGHLSPLSRAVPAARANDLRTLLTQLIAGPENASAFAATLPQGLSSADVLGLSMQDGTLLVNLSGAFAQAISTGSGDETLLCYSLVNTLCQATGLERVRFYFDGAMADTLAGKLCWGGEFLRSPGLIR